MMEALETLPAVLVMYTLLYKVTLSHYTAIMCAGRRTVRDHGYAL